MSSVSQQADSSYLYSKNLIKQITLTLYSSMSILLPSFTCVLKMTVREKGEYPIALDQRELRIYSFFDYGAFKPRVWRH